MTEIKIYLDNEILDATHQLNQLNIVAEKLQDQLADIMQRATEQASRKAAHQATLAEIVRQEKKETEGTNELPDIITPPYDLALNGAQGI